MTKHAFICHPWQLSCSVYPWSWLSSFQGHCFLLFILSFACVFVLFFIANHVCNGIVVGGHNAVISHTYLVIVVLGVTSPVIYDICSYVAHVLSSFPSLTTVFLAVLSIINLPNLTVNKFIGACCGWIYDPGKLIVQFSPTHQNHICMKFKQKNVIQHSLAHAHTHTNKNQYFSVDTVPVLCA